MKKILSLALVFFVVSLTFSILLVQIGALSPEPPVLEWDRTYGETGRDGAISVIQTSDGGYALVGYTNSFGADGLDSYLVKTDANGNMQWNKTYGGSNEDWAFSVVQTDDRGYAIAGTTTSFGAVGRDFWLVKTDANGNMQWNKTYGGTSDDQAYSVVQTSDGGYALGGSTGPSEPGNDDLWLVKTDADGNMQWNKTYGGTGDDRGGSMVQTSDGGYALTGYTTSFGAGDSDFWLVKTDASGIMQWNKAYAGTGYDGASSVVQTNDGGYAIAGDTIPFGAGWEGEDFWLVKTDASGIMQWDKTYGGTKRDICYSVVQTDDGGYAIAGGTYSFGTGGEDAWLVKTDASGNVQWDQTYGGTEDDYAYSVIQTSDGGYALAGGTHSFGAGDYDSWLIKLAPLKIPATLDIDPNSLNLGSKGRWITAYIELPEGYDVADIDVSSMFLDETIPVDPSAPIAVGDYDHDTIPDLMVKFDRAKVISYILGNIDIEERFTTVTLTITGKLYDETPFQGNDTIKIIMPMPRHWRLLEYY
jgi:hypothetical protein